ncbi:MAG: hypothetical protein NE334_17855 [Lentisphaeraceae bacterium]|nr:hypothetical protein [Lentisphaeraceae bacterium]
MNYHFEDFTEQHYESLVKKIQKSFTPVSYEEALLITHSGNALWRHDIDFSLQRALQLAKIEAKHGITSSYFIQLSSDFYNIFEESSRIIINQIIMLGHSIGIHFDPIVNKVDDISQLEESLLFEKQILEHYFNTNISAFSFHNPTPKTLEWESHKYAGLVNTYASHFRDNWLYISDSNGYWRNQRLANFLEENTGKNIQVLTHPAWWQENAIAPRERISRCIDQRAMATHKKYDHDLDDFKRKNIK